MARLTKRGTRKNSYVSAIGSGVGCWGRIIDRLASYEDTCLEPKEAQKISNVFRQISEEYNCWFDFAVKCVLEKANGLPNTPLTLEELRGMDGEPVWSSYYQCWGLISVHTSGKWAGVPFFIFTEDGCRHEKNIEQRRLTLYRRKPEEEC